MNEHFKKYYDAFLFNATGSGNNYYIKNIKPLVNQYCTLFPIPLSEILVNPKLEQNPNAR